MFSERVKNKYSEMSAGKKRIADFINENLADSVYMNAKEITVLSGISESVVVRFATFLGYDGFKDMQKSMQEEFKTKQSIYDQFVESVLTDNEDTTDTMKVYNYALKNLNDTIVNITEMLCAEKRPLRKYSVICIGMINSLKELEADTLFDTPS